MFADVVSRMFFKKSDYESLEELFKDVGKQIQILTKNNNSVIFYQFQDATDVYALEYSPIGLDGIVENPLFPSWLDSEEMITVQTARVLNRLADIDKEKETLEEVKNELDASVDVKDKESGGQA